MSKIVRVFGLIPGENNTNKNFNGEIVSLSDQGVFSFESILYTPHPKQTEEVNLLYPNVIWVKEPNLTPQDLESKDSVFVRATEISNDYA